MTMQAKQMNRSAKRPDAQRGNARQSAKRTAKERLYDLPRAAGVALMAIMLALALFAGNFRALQNAAPKAFLKQGDVASIVEDRAAQAGNAAMVARRAGLDEADILAVENALNALESAKTAREISRADQALSAAVSELTTAKLSGEEEINMLAAADNFAEQGSFLRQQARAYNEEALEAKELYDALPTRFILPEPDVYEGL